MELGIRHGVEPELIACRLHRIADLLVLPPLMGITTSDVDSAIPQIREKMPVERNVPLKSFVSKK